MALYGGAVRGDLLDLILIALAAAFAVAGYRQGFIVGVLSFVGFLGGAAVGAIFSPAIARAVVSGAARQALVAIIVVFLAAMIGQFVASLVGAAMRSRVTWRPATVVDAVGGAVVSVISVLLIAWLIGSAVANAPFPAVAGQVGNSAVLRGVDRLMPPSAHVVAGVRDGPTVVSSRDGSLTAHVVFFDAKRDVAVLYVPGLRARSLSFTSQASRGDNAIVAGYPRNQRFTAVPARIGGELNATSPDIYQSRTVTRNIYSVRAVVQPGNSGGPLLAPSGSVYGVVFAAAVDVRDTGYALTAGEVASDVHAGRDATAPVSTGGCD